MANQYISVNRKKYAVGLFWQPVAAGFVARNYARSLARSVDKKLNLYVDYKFMVGLTSRRGGVRPGMLSAAAEVMEAFSEYTSFLAVFQVDKSFYLVAARNGIILQDALFDNEDAARTEYVKMSEIPDWGALFAPGTWGMPRAAERNLGDLLLGHSHASLHAISRFRSGMLSAILLLLFLGAVFGLFREPIAEMMAPRPTMAEVNPELVAEYKKQIEAKNKELDAQFEIEKELPPEPIVMPYEMLPDPVVRAQLCYQAIGFLMQPISGWNQVYAECGENYATVEFRRSFGTLGDFYMVASELMPGALVQEVSDDVLRVRATLPAVPTVASQDERDADTIVRDVTSIFQGIDTSIQTEVVVDTLTNGVDVATVNVVEIGADSKLTPMQFMEIFQDFGGVYMTLCAWDYSSRTWNYEVIIYAK